jgi:hypothetical protein
MKWVSTWLFRARCVSFGGRRHERFNRSIGLRRRSNTMEFKMNIRLFSASAAASLGLAFSNGAQAWTVVRAAYVTPVVVYAPPPVPAAYVQAPQPAPTVYIPVPKPVTTASVSVVSNYAPMPAANVSYAQPVATVPVAGSH